MTFRHERRPASKPSPDRIKREITGRMMDRGAEESATDAMARALDAAAKAQPINIRYTADGAAHGVRGLSAEAMANGALHLGMGVEDLIDAEGRLYSVPKGVLAGQAETVEARAIVNSRACQFGAHLMPTPMNVRATGVAGVLEEIPSEFVTVRPVAFAQPPEVDGEPEVPDGPFPVSIARIDRDAFPQYAVRFDVKRRTMTRRGHRQLAGEIVAAITLGLGRAVDTELLTAIAATTPAPFTLQAAAASGVRFEELRALVGTGGAGASPSDGKLFAAGVSAELTGDAPGTIVAAFSRFAVATYDEVEILMQRTRGTGDLTVTAWMGLQALIPDGEFAWSLA